jgi:FKBP-type peptidyl-prolyl cis-trans isomerase 2
MIADGTEVTASYTFRDEAGTLIDSSDERGAMVFVQGRGTVLRGIENAVVGRGVGDRIHVELPPEQAFGPHRAELVFEAARANLPPDIVIEPGTELLSGMGDRPKFRLRVIKSTENGALLDGNHPLAGKTLIVDLVIMNIAPQT